MIDENTLRRFEECKKYLNLNQSSSGKYWTLAKNTFDIDFKGDKFINKGTRNYFPDIYDPKFNNDDLLDVNSISEKDKKIYR